MPGTDAIYKVDIGYFYVLPQLGYRNMFSDIAKLN